MENRLLKPAEVADRLGISTKTLFRYVAIGRFPPPIRLSLRTLRWQWGVVEKHLAETGSQAPKRLKRKRMPDINTEIAGERPS